MPQNYKESTLTNGLLERDFRNFAFAKDLPRNYYRYSPAQRKVLRRLEKGFLSTLLRKSEPPVFVPSLKALFSSFLKFQAFHVIL